MTQFSFFTCRINTKGAVPTSSMTEEELVSLVKSIRYKEITLACQQLPDKDSRDKLKKEKFDFVTISGIFSTRGNVNVQEFSGLCAVDFDTFNRGTWQERKDIVSKDPYVRISFITPSGLGSKLIIKIPKARDIEEFKNRVKAVYSYFTRTYGLQVKGQDAPDRATFVCYDPNIFFNPESQVFEEIQQEQEAKAQQEKDRTGRSDEEIMQILNKIEPDCDYDTWLKVLAGLRRYETETGRSLIHLADKWSSKGKKYKSFDDVRSHYESFKDDGKDKIHFGTIIELAKGKKGKLEEAIECYQGFYVWDTDKKGQPIKKLVMDIKKGNQLMAEFYLETNNIIYDPLNDQLKIYGQRQFYEPLGEHIIKQFIEMNLTKHNNRNVQAEILNKLKNLAIPTTSLKPTPLNLLPFKNGVLDINTMQMRDHSPFDYFEYQVPIKYNPNAQCLEIDKFINEVVEPGKTTLIYDCLGLILYRQNLLEKIFIFLGSGQNGKTILIKVFENAVGEENCSSIPLNQLTEDRFAVASTHKKLLNCGADIGGKTITDASMLRSLSSKDRVSAQFKYGQIFPFEPTATQVFSANNPPIFIEDCLGTFRRLETVSFPNNYGNEADLKEHPDWKKADPLLLEKLINPAELEGFIAKAVNHLKKIIETSALSVVRSTDSLRYDYIKVSDSLKAFLEEKCEEVLYEPSDSTRISREFIPAQGCITKSEFYSTYKKWCNLQKVKYFSTNKVGRLIKDYGWGITFGKDRMEEKGDQQETYRGLRWK